ncbi:MAG: RNase P subunit p30 family protein [Nanoarchaeota archaeon]
MIDILFCEAPPDLVKKLGWKGTHNGKGGLVAKPFTPEITQAMERGQVDCVFGFETEARKDDVRQRSSGMNEALVKLMRQKNIAYGIPFPIILSAQGGRRAQLLGRIMQNIRLARKGKLDICLASFAEKPGHMRSPSDLSGFAQSLGLRPEEAKKALLWTEKRILQNKARQEGRYVSKDLQIG